jgi:hypothetical protein
MSDISNLLPLNVSHDSNESSATPLPQSLFLIWNFHGIIWNFLLLFGISRSYVELSPFRLEFPVLIWNDFIWNYSREEVVCFSIDYCEGLSILRGLLKYWESQALFFFSMPLSETSQISNIKEGYLCVSRKSGYARIGEKWEFCGLRDFGRCNVSLVATLLTVRITRETVQEANDHDESKETVRCLEDKWPNSHIVRLDWSKYDFRADTLTEIRLLWIWTRWLVSDY